MGFGPGNKASEGRGTRGSARPKTGRPREEARVALSDLIHQRGLREKALQTLELALQAKDCHGQPTTVAIKAAELLLERTDPMRQRMEHGGRVEVVVTYEGA